ncbi:bifunctional DNA primase/polymerase [Pseudomonas sp. 148P]|uniref:Bifunctional DNA primase/polymerase n=1 Tax=Pseudomonas ulcerans TaxID=3115852 RepID=A0ABU7HW29_9PSED|nr:MULTISPECIES: bifunctional DNA primase/polymerase [unclassified Pseudomonas]MEE1922888.1 bifunctional DNA primase/polymerase [Pseudomonas sp. 147P]MEE1935738.1 bifunctional DNA primase/polymerase [Pseudomonas sp. 148P]
MSERPTTATADWARRYIEAFGLALVPIAPGDKAPKGDAWNKPGGYFTDADEAETFWQAHPRHNLGVVLGPSGVCSLDVDDVDMCRIVLQSTVGLNLDLFAEQYPTVVGNPARYRLLFRVPDGVELTRRALAWPSKADPDGSIYRGIMAQVKSARDAGDTLTENALLLAATPFKKVTVFELRGGLVQDVLPPSIHPQTGKPYFWRKTPDAAGLPVLPAELLNIWQGWDEFKAQAEAACPWRPKPSATVLRAVAKPRPLAQSGNRDLPEVIPEFNRVHDIATMIEAHGYKRMGDKWLCPHSSSGDPGVTITDGKLYSHHGSDPLANGHKNDAFDVYCILMHDGDHRAATRAAAVALGLDARSRPPEPPPLGELPRTPSLVEQFAQASEGDAPAADQEAPSPADREVSSSVEGGAGESGLVLKSALRRFALVEGTTNVWDMDKGQSMKRSGFEALIGKPAAKAWMDRTDKKLVSSEQVKELEQARRMSSKKGGAMNLAPLDRYVYIDGTKEAWDREKKRRLPEGSIKMALGDAYQLWLNSPTRRVVDVDHIVFDPTMTKDPAVYINTFEGLPLEPVRDDAACENLRWLVSFLCNHDAEALEWLTRWLAYPLQHMGAKMDTAILFHSTMEGSGKSLLFSDVMGELYGRYGATVGQQQLEGNFNAWQSGKLWAVFEEVVSRDQRYNQVGKIKHMVTGKTVRMESKFINGWEESNHMNSAFLSNEIMPWPISEDDRRMLVMWPQETLPAVRQKAIARELANGGVAALYGWLLSVDLADFDQRTRPPKTEARQRLVELSRTAWQTFYSLWRLGELGHGLWGCALTSDVYAMFLEWCSLNKEHSMSQTKFSLMLSAKVDKTRAIPWTDGNTRRFAAFFFPSDGDPSLPPSLNAAELGKNVSEWRARAKLAGWTVDGWDHVKRTLAA